MDKLREEVNRLFLEASERGWDITRTKLILLELLDRGYDVGKDKTEILSIDFNDVDRRLNCDEGEE